MKKRKGERGNMENSREINGKGWRGIKGKKGARRATIGVGGGDINLKKQGV